MKRGVEKVAIDDSIEMPELVPMEKTIQEETEKKVERQTVRDEIEDVPCCLKNEKVIVKFIPKPSEKITNPRHIFYGGMADTATMTLVVPKLSTGMYKNVLTDAEKQYLERAMGLEDNALSIYRKIDNFWDDSNPNGIGKVTLHKQDNYLDLSTPEGYIKYKILLANKDLIAPDLQTLQDRPKATYRYVILSEDTESKASSNQITTTMQCYKEYGKIEDDIDTLRLVVELLEGRPTASKTKIEYLQGKINEHIQAKPKVFLKIVTDPLLKTKVLIRKSVEAGLIGKKNDCYFLRSDNTALCEMNEESTLTNAARYLNNVKRQELLFMLQAKTK